MAEAMRIPAITTKLRVGAPRAGAPEAIGAARRAAGSPLARPRGFTITELLVSLVVISIGVIGFATAVGVMSKELWYGNRDTELALLAADQMERLKSMPPDSVRSGSRDEGAYRLAWTVQGADPKKVVLVASYVGGRGQTRADTIVTYVMR
jgi:prepilin-type N-terminal cleavage/methylation domain-containing protein